MNVTGIWRKGNLHYSVETNQIVLKWFVELVGDELGYSAEDFCGKC
jgi:hypothetical protein